MAYLFSCNYSFDPGLVPPAEDEMLRVYIVRCNYESMNWILVSTLCFGLVFVAIHSFVNKYLKINASVSSSFKLVHPEYP